ncbi:MAG: alpha/beta hydrolase-fold protein [Pelolinea sp.]|nr:alpha/beta hydrolase-fold protein [Pelolinea sp.]
MREKKLVVIRSIIPVIFLIIFLTGCSQPEVVPTATVFPPPLTPQATQLTQSTDPIDPNQQVQTAEECSSGGTVERYQLDSTLLNGALYFSVYYPPCYSDAKPDGYPVLYALHGQNFNDEMWVDLGAVETIDRLILDGEAEPFLMVMPFEEFYFREAEGNNFPIALKEEVIPWVEGSLNVCAEKTCRAIGGISRGASWAARIGLAEWDYFGSVGAHSLPTFRGDIGQLPEWLEAIPFGEEPRIYLDTGRFDPEVKNSYRFEQVLNEKGIPHDWHMNNGRHNEAYWQQHMLEYIRWYVAGWDIDK